MNLNTDKMIAEKDGGIGWMTFNNPAKHNATSIARLSRVNSSITVNIRKALPSWVLAWTKS